MTDGIGGQSSCCRLVTVGKCWSMPPKTQVFLGIRMPTGHEHSSQRRPALRDRVKACPIEGDSTVSETRYVTPRWAAKNPKSVLLVTSDFHTRRALSIFRRRLPDQTWYIAAATDPTQFSIHWWRKRKCAK